MDDVNGDPDPPEDEEEEEETGEEDEEEEDEPTFLAICGQSPPSETSPHR